MSPFKKLDAFSVELGTIPKSKPVSMFITDDEENIVFDTSFFLILWSIKQKKIIDTKDYRSFNTVADGKKIFTIRNDEKSYARLLNEQKKLNKNIRIKNALIIDIWDIRTLKKINSINVSKLKGMRYEDRIYVTGSGSGHLLVGEKMLYYFVQGDSHLYIMVGIDKSTYKLKYIEGQIGKFIKRIDNRLIYRDKFLLVERLLDLNTGEIIKTAPGHTRGIGYFLRKKDKYNLRVLPASSSKYVKSDSVAKNLLLRHVNRRLNYAFYDTGTGKRLASMYQFENNEAVLMDANGYFEMTKNARAYMKEINKKREIRPISDVVFQKYNKKLNIKAH